MDYSGGQLTDWVGHHMDIAMWSLGLEHTGPVEIQGKATFEKGDLFDVPRTFDVDTKWANGLDIKLANANNLTHGKGTCWYGEKGWIFVNRKVFKASDEKLLSAPVPESISKKFRHNDVNHWDNFIQGIKTGKTPVANVEASRA